MSRINSACLTGFVSVFLVYLITLAFKRDQIENKRMVSVMCLCFVHLF